MASWKKVTEPPRSGAKDRWNPVAQGLGDPLRIVGSLQLSARQKLRYSTGLALSGLVVLLLFLVWYFVSRAGIYPDFILPSPGAVLHRLVVLSMEGYVGKNLAEHFGITLFRAGFGFVLASVVGVGLGLAMGVMPKMQATFDPFIEFYRPIPPLAYLTLLVIWMGIGEMSKITLLLLSALPPVVISTSAAVRSVRKERINGARSLGATEWQMFRHVIFPSCLPGILTGIRLAFGLSYATIVAAEMIAAASGLGFMVLHAQRYLRTDVIFVVIFIMAATGILLEQIFRWTQGRLVPWTGKG